ncbi:hypothetical protein E2C01_030026 [Portunus trituberculatus]|uniref:Uncharacterized protein n=1 Tax=Portunus trituberculatus TaxID=210409 RepID=A0A5B7EUK4_PORTR|nr:hypothetical protein [Portunus trituberculatus]
MGQECAASPVTEHSRSQVLSFRLSLEIKVGWWSWVVVWEGVEEGGEMRDVSFDLIPFVALRVIVRLVCWARRGGVSGR